MDPQTQFCPNMACPARGKINETNIVVHSRKERRYKCKVCGKTFAGYLKEMNDLPVTLFRKETGQCSKRIPL